MQITRVGKVCFPSVAFPATGVGVNQAGKHNQIVGKTKRACADSRLKPGFAEHFKSHLGYVSHESKVLSTRENQVSVGEHLTPCSIFIQFRH